MQKWDKSDPPVITNPPGVIFGSVLKWKNLHQELTLRSKLICVIPENHHYLNHTNLIIKIKMKINYDFLDWHKLILISKWDLLMEVFSGFLSELLLQFECRRILINLTWSYQNYRCRPMWTVLVKILEAEVNPLYSKFESII